MQHINKIQEMIKNGKISQAQGKILIDAFEQSKVRQSQILNNISEVKQGRNKQAWGFLGLSLVFMICFLSVLIFSTSFNKFTRDENKALDLISNANSFLVDENYDKAIDIYQQAIRKTPNFNVTYIALGMAQKIAFYQTDNIEFKNSSDQNFIKANELSEKTRRNRNMGNASILFLILFLILIIGAISIVLLFLYNILVRREELVNESWAHIDNFAQRKIDLMPALIEVVKDYATHEQQTLQSVIDSRNDFNQVLSMDQGCVSLSGNVIEKIQQAQDVLSSGLNKIKALAENYPNLLADQHYLTLQMQIEETENLIVKERTLFNRRVGIYNSALNMFPFNLIALVFKFEPKQYFQKES